ncbi:MAG: NAD(P)H-hydrate dehydratase, partial [Proteobacteria bacterium]|nr:NAD(P)H-hydrate dehydratase [Pseudomonadota bacterium]
MAFCYHAPHHLDGNYSVSPADLRSWEHEEIESKACRGRELMEIAGRSVAMHVLSRYPETQEVLVFCGPGNNGGDGFVAASYLSRCGIDVHLFVFCEEASRTPDAREMFERVRGLPRTVLNHPGDASVISAWARRRNLLIIDAIYGTGYRPAHDALLSCVCEHIAARGCPVVSVDIASGIDAQTGYRCKPGAEESSSAVQASDTVTFVAPKHGHFFGDGPAYSGDLFCVDIGLGAWPRDLKRALVLSDAWCVRAYWGLCRRAPDVHKGKCGHVGIVGGHETMPGASCLCGRAALVSGAGLVTVGARHGMRVDDELMVRELCADGRLDAGALEALFGRADSLVVGPGLGRDDVGLDIVRRCAGYRGALVLDADALWAAAKLDQAYEAAACFMTPHPAEAARLLGVTVREILGDPLRYAHEISEKYGVTTVLKSHATVVASRETRSQPPRFAVLPYPNPAIATAGAGDVLAGVLGGLLGQRRCGALPRAFDAFDIACMAVSAHSAE